MNKIVVKKGLRESSFLECFIRTKLLEETNEPSIVEYEDSQSDNFYDNIYFLYTPKRSVVTKAIKKGSKVVIFCDHFYSSPSMKLVTDARVKYYCLNEFWNSLLVSKGISSEVYFWQEDLVEESFNSNRIIIPAINPNCYGLLDKFLPLFLKFKEKHDVEITLACVLSKIGLGLKKQLKTYRDEVNVVPLRDKEDLLREYRKHKVVFYPSAQILFGACLYLGLFMDKDILVPYSDAAKSILGGNGRYIKCKKDTSDNIIYNNDFEQSFFGELGRLIK